MLHIQKISRSSLQSVVSIFFLITLLGLFNSRVFAKKSPSNEDLLKNSVQGLNQYLKQTFDKENSTKDGITIKFEDFLKK